MIYFGLRLFDRFVGGLLLAVLDWFDRFLEHSFYHYISAYFDMVVVVGGSWYVITYFQVYDENSYWTIFTVSVLALVGLIYLHRPWVSED